MDTSDRFFAEWEREPPNGIYPTLDEWGVALEAMKRFGTAPASESMTVTVQTPTGDNVTSFRFQSVDVELGRINRSVSAQWRNHEKR